MNPPRIFLQGDKIYARYFLHEAKRQLQELKRRVETGLGQLSRNFIFEDGRVVVTISSVAGVDTIVISAVPISVREFELRPVDSSLIFLITNETSYACFSFSAIAGFKAVDFNIGFSAVSLPFEHGLSVWPQAVFWKNSTVQSNKDLSFHRYSVCQTFNSNPTADSVGIGCRYATMIHEWTEISGLQHKFIQGQRNGFYYPGYDITAKEQFDTSLLYTTYNTSYSSYPAYECGSRKNFIIDPTTGQPINNLEMWRTSSGLMRIEYDDATGHKTDGASLSITDNLTSCFAVLSKTKYWGYSSAVSYDNSTHTHVDQNLTCVFPVDGVQANLNGDFGTIYTIKFGDHIIEELNHRTNVATILTEEELNCGTAPGCADILTRYLESVTSTDHNPIGVGMDYDSFNIDEDFILFYYISDLSNETTWTGRMPDSLDGSGGSGGTKTEKDTLDMKFYLAYKTKDELLVKVELASLSCVTNDISETAVTVSDACGNTNVKIPKEWTSHWSIGVNGMSGTRISRPSCKATEDYLLYTYVKQTYNGPDDEMHFGAYNDDYWINPVRYLGVIDRTTGVRTETEINATVLGVHTKRFDILLQAALGQHLTKRAATLGTTA